MWEGWRGIRKTLKKLWTKYVWIWKILNMTLKLHLIAHTFVTFYRILWRWNTTDEYAFSVSESLSFENMALNMVQLGKIFCRWIWYLVSGLFFAILPLNGRRCFICAKFLFFLLQFFSTICICCPFISNLNFWHHWEKWRKQCCQIVGKYPENVR